MSINPQYMRDANGQPVGVFLSLEEWNALCAHLPEEDVAHSLPAWQQAEVLGRLAEIDSRSQRGDTDSAIEADVFLKELQGLDESEAQTRY